jgi:hypothetical protein
MLEKTYAETLATLEEVVAEAGEDFKYQDHYGNLCHYSVDGEPACIVGRVLAKWGVLPESADSRAEGPTVGMFSSELLGHLEKLGILKVDEASNRLLQEAQYAQDGTFKEPLTWGGVIEYAKGIV